MHGGFEFVFVNNAGKYVEINEFSNGLNVCIAKSYFGMKFVVLKSRIALPNESVSIPGVQY
jgi:hypothetical protein